MVDESSVNVGKTDNDRTSAPSSIRVNNETRDLTRATISKNKKSAAEPFNSTEDTSSSNSTTADPSAPNS